MGCVYRLTFPNGKSYVGLTLGTAEDRFARHVKESKGLSNKIPLRAAIRKYGTENVQISELARSEDRTELGRLEIAFIAQLGTMVPRGYNCTEGGDGVVGLTAEAELRRRTTISKSLTGKKLSEAHKLSLSKSHLGLPSDRKGKTASEETRRKQSEAAKRRWQDPVQRTHLEAHLLQLNNCESRKTQCQELGKSWKGKKRK